MTASVSRRIALVAAVLLAVWSILAFARAASWTRDRPAEHPKLRVSMWKLGGPQAEGLRSFLDQRVRPRVEPGAVIVLHPQALEYQDAITLLGWFGYLLPENRVIGLERLSTLETDRRRYLVRFPGPGEENQNPKLELLEWEERGSLYRFSE